MGISVFLLQSGGELRINISISYIIYHSNCGNYKKSMLFLPLLELAIGFIFRLETKKKSNSTCQFIERSMTSITLELSLLSCYCCPLRSNLTSLRIYIESHCIYHNR